MIDLLEALRKRAVDLRRVGMMQSAGDYDYLVAWLKSPEFNNGEHLKPHPAGENTIDEYSNNCPIPFTPSRRVISCCVDNDRAEQLIQSARYIISELLNVYTDDIEQIAINAYLDYSDKIITLLGGEVPVPMPPEPPDPPEPLKSSIGGTMAITDEGVSSAIYDTHNLIGKMEKGQLTQEIDQIVFQSYNFAEGGEMLKGGLTQSIEMKSFVDAVIFEGGSMQKDALTQSIYMKSFINSVIYEGGSMTIETEG